MSRPLEEDIGALVAGLKQSSTHRARHYYHRTGDRRFLPQWELQQFVENVKSLRAQDVTYTEIARRLKVGRQTIRQRIKRAGVIIE